MADERDEAKEAILTRGGKAAGSVSKKPTTSSPANRRDRNTKSGRTRRVHPRRRRFPKAVGRLAIRQLSLRVTAKGYYSWQRIRATWYGKVRMTHRELHHDGYPTHRRKARFDWSNTPLHWVPGDPFTTHMLNVLHLLLPVSERWFIQAITEAEPLVDDAELKAAIKPFIQQEAWHAWAHQMVLQHLAEQGLDTKPYTDRLQKWLSKIGTGPGMATGPAAVVALWAPRGCRGAGTLQRCVRSMVHPEPGSRLCRCRPDHA